MKFFKCLRRLLRWLGKRGHTNTHTHNPCYVKLTVNGQYKGKYMANIGQTASIEAVFKDVKGNPTAISGVPVWSVSEATLVTITPSLDGLSATLVSNGTSVTTSVTVTFGAISGSVDVEFAAGEAVSVTLKVTVA
jgi:hypothetical protein